MIRATPLACLAALLLALAPGLSAAPGPAEADYLEGRRLYEAADYPGARVALERAVELILDPGSIPEPVSSTLVPPWKPPRSGVADCTVGAALRISTPPGSATMRGAAPEPS